MKDRGSNPSIDTVKILDQLKGRLNEAEFRSKHHMGSSIAAFRRYCLDHKSFRRNSRNLDLHEWLQKKLDKA
jgi:hypothetical protein